MGTRVGIGPIVSPSPRHGAQYPNVKELLEVSV